MAGNNYMTVPQYAEACGVSAVAIYDRIKQGSMKPNIIWVKEYRIDPVKYPPCSWKRKKQQ